MMQNVAILIFSVLLICCSSSRQVDSKKFDSPLKLKLTELENNKSDETLKIFVKCSQTITADIRSSLEKTGITVESVMGTILTGSGTAQQIRQLSTLEIVNQVNLSTTSKPLY